MDTSDSSYKLPVTIEGGRSVIQGNFNDRSQKIVDSRVILELGLC